MDCNRCKVFLDKNCFSYCEKTKRYYLTCNDCRTKLKEYNYKKYTSKYELNECHRCKKKFSSKYHLYYHQLNTKSCKIAHEKNIEYYRYSVLELRKICLANGIKNYARMKKDDIIKELIKIENVIIPDEVI